MKKELTAAQKLTNSILDYLNYGGYYAWRNHSTGIFDRKINKFRIIGKKGVSDIIGMHKATGKFIAIEIKIYPDKPSIHQIDFIDRVNKYGGFGMICYTLDSFMERIKQWQRTI